MSIIINNHYSNTVDTYKLVDFQDQMKFMKFYKSIINNDLVWDNFVLLTYNCPCDWHFCLSNKAILTFDFIEKEKTFKLMIKVNGESMLTTLPNHFTIKDIREKYNYTSTQKKFYYNDTEVEDSTNVKELIGDVVVGTIWYLLK